MESNTKRKCCYYCRSAITRCLPHQGRGRRYSLALFSHKVPGTFLPFVCRACANASIAAQARTFEGEFCGVAQRVSEGAGLYALEAYLEVRFQPWGGVDPQEDSIR